MKTTAFGTHPLFNALTVVAIGALAFGCAGEARESGACPKNASSITTTNASNGAGSSGNASRAEANKALVKAYMDDVWGKRNVDSLEKYLATDLVNHSATPERQGAAGLRTIATQLFKAFPDLSHQITQIVAEDDTVVVRQVHEGTHTGPLEFKTLPLAATNKHMKIEQVFTYRIKDGRIAETWMVMDKLDFLRQLGVAPPPPSSR